MRTPLFVAVLALFGVGSIPQQSSLPSSMIAEFGPERTWAEEFRLPVASSGDYVRARLTFDNSGASGRIDIDWLFQKAGAAARTSSQSVEVSFRPTSIARRAGTSSRFYVTGWSERTGRLLVEEWTFGAFVLGNSITPSGQPTVSTFSQPPISRVVEWISDPGEIGPVWDSAVEVYGNDLLLLASGTPTRIYSLDLGSRSLAVLFDATTHPALAGHRMLTASRHGTNGMLAFTERRKPWENMAKYAAPDQYFVMHDANIDGTIESVSTVGTHQFYVVYPPPWNDTYAE